MVAAASAHVNMRVAPSALEIIDEAATVQGIARTAFVIDAAVSRARTVLLEERLRVTTTEVAQIKRLLTEDREPTDALRAAAERIKELGI